jgi:hypothetical protein
MFSFKNESALVFHIGSASVGAGLVQLEQGQPPRIIYSLREPIPYRDSVTADRFVADMLSALKQVNTRIAKEAPRGFSAKHVFYVFSSPWIATQTKIVSMKEVKPFKLTRRHVQRIVDSQTKAAPGLQLLEKRVIDIRLNGYQIPDPYGKKATNADISLFMSFIPKTLLDSVMEISARTFHPKDTRVSSFTLASFLLIRETFPHDNDFIFLDIGGELSDIAIVKEGLILETASFPMGRYFLTRKIQKDLDVSAEEAVSLIRVYEDGLADENLIAGLKPILDGAAAEWVKGFRVSLSKLGKGMTWPMKIFLTIHSDFNKFFVRVLSAEHISKLGVAEVAMSIVPLNEEAIKASVSFSDDALRDSFIAISSALAGKLYESTGR